MRRNKFFVSLPLIPLLFAALVLCTTLPLRAAPLQAAGSDGKIVTLQTDAARIVSLSPAATEVLFAIGAGPRVVGNTNYCDYPPEAAALPKIGGFSAKNMSVEKIIALKPDLVVSAGSIHQSVADALSRFNIPVFVYAPNTFSEISRDMTAMSSLTGTQKQAQSAAARMMADIDAVHVKIASLAPTEKRTVFWEVYDEPLMTCGASTFQHAIVEAAGGVDIFSDLPGSWPRVSAEEVLRRAPQVIAGADDHGDKLTREQVAARPGWQTVPAVRDGSIYLVPAALVSRPTPRIAQGVAALAKALYPKLFP